MRNPGWKENTTVCWRLYIRPSVAIIRDVHAEPQAKEHGGKELKDSCKSRLFTGMFLFNVGFLLIALNGCAVLKQVQEIPIEIQDEQEILVAEDIGRGGDIFSSRWCGNNALLYEGDNIGIEMIDFITKERVEISETGNDTALNCSPDGKLVLYESYSIIRTEKEGDMEFDEYIKHSREAGTNARYIYRYAVSTGRKERVAVAGLDEGGSYEAISPDGKKILLGNKHLLNTDIYVTEWEPVWFSNDGWERYDTRWFADSSGVVIFRHNPNRICVEFFGKDGWGKCFEPDLKYKENIYGFQLGRDGNIYFHESPLSGGKRYIYHCKVSSKELLCDEAAEYAAYDVTFDFLPDGGIVFQKTRECIMRGAQWRVEEDCLVDKRYNDRDYAIVEMVGVSPNGRWLAFQRYRKKQRLNRGWPVYQVDLFVIETSKIRIR